MPPPLLILCILLVIFLFPIAQAALSLAPWVPTRTHDVNRLLQFLKLSPGDVFIELGSGTANVTRAVAAKFPHAQCIGLERAWPIHLVAKYLARDLKNCTLLCKNLFKYNLSGATVIYIFGMPAALRSSITEKILRECKPGTRVISYSFRIPALPLVQHHKTSDSLSLYEYLLH